MSYNRYPYAMFNPAYMNAEYLQRLERQKNEIEQNQKIAEMVKAVKDLCRQGGAAHLLRNDVGRITQNAL